MTTQEWMDAVMPLLWRTCDKISMGRCAANDCPLSFDRDGEQICLHAMSADDLDNHCPHGDQCPLCHPVRMLDHEDLARSLMGDDRK